MNYLAHALLSKNDPGLLVGNFIADHIRGNDFGKLSPEVIEGIYLHRRIDTFTDAHPEFKKAKRLFYDGFEKHSGILIDIYFDHLLASSFEMYHPKSLHEFAETAYSVYSANQELLPISSSRFLEYAIKNNIYVSYASIDGIERVLYHLSQRIRHNVKLDHSLHLFNKNEMELRTAFALFFDDARKEFL
jgi:acyl carrier protein phosphodiesterase